LPLTAAVAFWVGCTTGIKEGDIQECYVLGSKGKKIDLSLRPSRVNNLRVPKDQLSFPEIESAADLAVGKTVRGYVSEVNKLGVFVALSRYRPAAPPPSIIILRGGGALA
jgi:RecJ-like exonuclease